MSDLVNLRIAEAVALLNNKEISAVELTTAHLQEMEKARFLNTYITETPEEALKQAEESDTRRAAGSILGALDGIPIAHKDLFCTKDIRTTAASKILKDFVPPYESTVSAKLLAAGCITLGKVNCDQFGMGVATVNSHFGTTKNPWTDEKGEYSLVAGGSSGGSAAAVAAGLCMAATGTDTGGSSRQPAAFCGVVGVKPTYGRCSRWGVVAYASSLDQPGVLARSVQDAALMLGQMAGYDSKDSTSANVPVPDYTALLNTNLKGKKIGIPIEYRLDGLNEEVSTVWKKGIETLKTAGAEIIDVSLPHTKYALPVYYILSPAEASSNLSRYDGVRFTNRVPAQTVDEMYKKTRTDGFGEEVLRRIFLGTFVLSTGFYDAYYTRALKVRRLIYNDFVDVYKNVDALLVPTAPTPALSEQQIKQMSPVEAYMADVFTTPASLAGVPAVNVPAGFATNGLPIGLQVITPHFAEATALQIARVIEQNSDFDLKPVRVK